ncbi:hypothetical protein BJY16_005412 [Actinoplanes octamycinicus]|uniref:Secreted protein n=1 Tax=Actinoplanes octamycinicus TaxID=135948 RepID=A0A7W7H121_9ACTN|nr:hypothetical protein [Actinoplanes octamycinicus]MBB4741953.1 hypothetical protein [Actinoplanes octamycinicus]
MRNSLIALGVLVLVSIAACRPAPQSPSSSAAASSPSSGAAMSTPSPSPGAHRRTPSPPASRSDPEQPQDRVGAPIVLTGPIETSGECVVLTVDGHRWALVRLPLGQFADGETITVRGRPAAVPPGCDAEWAITVHPR